jgi:PPOX class probable F420-dependent enzyme
VRVNARRAIRLTDAEATELLAAGGKLQLATINADGTPHLVTMYYALVDGRIAFWTYRTSQKARNLERDPRVTCLVEAGDDYFSLRGVQVNGVVQPTDDPVAVAEIGARVVAGSLGLPAEHLDGYVAQTAPKRRGYLVEPVRTASWDHRKLNSQ